MRHPLVSLTGVAQLLLRVGATPILGLPFDQQLPDVARVGRPYGFTFSPETFRSSDTGDVWYSASGLPDWLSFDSGALRLSGTPSQAGNVTFTVTGSDGSGSLDQECLIIVTQDQGPVLSSEAYLYRQLAEYGSTNGYDGFVVEPEADFSISFARDTFTMASTNSSSGIVAYYGRSSNKSSLPIWCDFNVDNLTFSGTAPPVNALDAPSQEFDLYLIATDYAGYSGAYGAFHLVVGGHTLTSDDDVIYINTTAGSNFSQEIPLDTVYLDGSEITSGNISSVDLFEGPDWVSISDDNSTLVGTVPNATDDAVLMNVTVTDIYGDSVYIPFEVSIVTNVFAEDDLPSVNATRGEFFRYTLPSRMFHQANTTRVSVDIGNSNSTHHLLARADSWLQFYSANRTFVGTVPNSFSSLQVAITGTLGRISQTKSFTVRGVAGHTTSSSSSSTSSSSSSTSSSPTPTTSTSSAPIATSTPETHHHGLSNRTKLAIGLGVGLPLGAIILGAILLAVFMRRKNGDDDEKGTGENSSKPSVRPSAPNTPHPPAAGAALVPPRRLPINRQVSNRTLSYGNHGNSEAEKNAAELEGVPISHSSSSSSQSSQSTTTDVEEKQEDERGMEAYPQSGVRETSGSRGSPNRGAGAVGGRSSKASKTSSRASRIRNSWRRTLHRTKSSWKPRDSLTSLATVATNDLLTMNVVDDPNMQRRSQMNLLLRRSNANLSSNNLSNTNLITSYRNTRVASIASSLGGEFSSGSARASTVARKASALSTVTTDDTSSSSSNLVLVRSKTPIELAGPAVSPLQAHPGDVSGNTTSSSSAELVDFQDRPAIQTALSSDDNHSSRGVIEQQ